MNPSRTPSPEKNVQSIPFSFESHSVAPASVWHRCGEGEAVFRLRDTSVQVEERGGWWESGEKASDRRAFRKSFALERRDSGRLAYVKFTPDGSRQDLLDLIRRGEGEWTSPEPHLCGNDIYRAELAWEADTLRLAWWSRGPEKNYGLHTRYSQVGWLRTWMDA